MPPSRAVLVHGFTQTGASWDALVPRFEAKGLAVETPAVPAATDLPSAAAALGREYGRAAWVGYSMGGRIALHLGLDAPGLVEAMVLVGATAGIDDPVDRATRRESDEGLACLVERIGVGPFLDQWLAQPLFAGLDHAAAGRQARLANPPSLLAAHLRNLGTGTQAPLWARLPELAMPVLIVAGERDRKFTALGRRLVAGIGSNADLVLVPGAGHACHLERPDEFAAAVVPFLAAVGQSSSPMASSTP
jgi:2-succinyl-6-hydroxy-2,4-cyclohexadiene-1-carboxylate synthase